MVLARISGPARFWNAAPPSLFASCGTDVEGCRAQAPIDSMTRASRPILDHVIVLSASASGTRRGDVTGISNVIIRPNLFDRQRTEAVRMPFLLVDGIMQQQDGVRSVKAERLDKLTASVDAHAFY